MSRFMKNLFFLILTNSFLHACQYKKSESNKHDEFYLSIDSIYKNDIELEKFKSLKKTFLKIWLDSANCYTSDYRLKSNDPKEDSSSIKRILDVKIDNILHSSNYDTVAVILALYAAWIDKDGKKDGELTRSYIMKAIIDKDRNWKFDCTMNNFGLYDTGRNTITDILERYRKMILNSGYLKSDGKPNPNYLKNLFLKEVDFSKQNK